MSSTPSPSPHGEQHLKALDQHGLRMGEDDYVEWKTDESQHPRNWSNNKRIYNVALVSFLEFWMTAISSAGTAASNNGRMEYGISRTVGYLIFTSLYLFGQATGSIFCSPISETFGRRTLYIVSVSLYCVMCAIIAAVPSPIAVAIGRFISGAASAIPATVAFGSFNDMYRSQTRIWVVYLYTVTGNCGLVMGPIFSSYISTYVGWRWVFYISTMVSGVGIVFSFFLHESRTDYLLELKVKKINREHNLSHLKVASKKKVTFHSFLQDALFRPLLFLVTEPIVLCCSILMVISFSLIYGLTEGLTVVYTAFGFAEDTTSSLAFIPILIGLLLDVLPRWYEHKKFIRFRAENRPLRPETKADSLAIACPALAIGLWIFAWTVPPLVTNVHWIVSMLGLVLVGFATNDLSYILFGYLTDAYGPYAASACAALGLSRTLMAGIFPLFTHGMYSGLGGNRATTVFAAVATVFAFSPFVILRYGAQVRRMSRFAVGDDDEGKGDDEEKAGEGQKGNEKAGEESKEKE